MSYLPLFLTDRNLTQNMEHPRVPFLVGPKDYRIIDGDTLWILGRLTEERRILHGNMRPEAMRIRHRTIDAPERPRYNMNEAQLLKLGLDAHEANPGVVATKILRDMCRKKVIYIEPTGVDVYGRMLADIAVSGAPGPEFEMEGCFSTEREMIRLQAAKSMVDHADLPPHMPLAMEAMLRQARGSMPTRSDGPDM